VCARDAPPDRRNVYERGQSLAWVPLGREGGGRAVVGTQPGAQAEARGDLVRGRDGRLRCWWVRGSELLEDYHDDEWGHGPRDERGLFERLSLEAFQAGLSWRIVLERRTALRSALAGFDPSVVAGFAPTDVDAALARPGVIRNRAKVEAIVANARILLDLHATGSGLRATTERALAEAATASGAVRRGSAPRRRADVPAHSPASGALARHLRALGWRFVGPTTAYAYLQATGWVDDHLVGCHARAAAHLAGAARPLR
jgi:DNA-3-methyladenine glycosylase I